MRRSTGSQSIKGGKECHQGLSLSEGFTIESQPEGEAGERQARLSKGTKESELILFSQQIFTKCLPCVPSTEV